MDLATYQIIWYSVVGLVITGYTILDGFDLGVGAVHLFAKGDQNRRIFLNAIGPVWDGNEVWLVVLIGGTFAGFPIVYATVLSGFYNLMMMFIFALVFRAVAIEFRSKRESKVWRSTWDIVFSVMSIYLAFSFGLVLGNIIQGIPINQDGQYMGTFSQFFTLYPIIVGITSLSLLVMHGCIYLLMKTEGEIHDRLRRWLKPSMLFFILSFIVLSIVTVTSGFSIIGRIEHYPGLCIFPVFAVLTIGSIPILVKKGFDGWAFISSCLCIASFFLLYGVSTYPNLVTSTIDPAYNLTIFNSSSSKKTLSLLVTIVLIGMPLVLAYGYWVYRIFRGKVEIDHMSY